MSENLVAKYMDLLGYPVEDCVTKFKGTVTSVSFDLYGCVMCVVTPDAKDGKTGESAWFDAKRLVRDSKTRRMQPQPFYDLAAGQERGPAEKPARRL